MSWTPEPIQNLYLIKLLAKGGECKMSEIHPPLKPVKKRNELVDNGFLEQEKRGGTLYIWLSEKGWNYISENPAAEISKRAQTGAVLTEVFLRIAEFRKRKSIPLAEIFGDMPILEEPNDDYKAIEAKDSGGVEDVERMIRSAYAKISKGEWNVRVRLTDMRKLLSNVPRKVLDENLLKMQEDDKLVLYQLDDPLEIGHEDEDAAIDISGFKRHIIYMRA